MNYKNIEKIIDSVRQMNKNQFFYYKNKYINDLIVSDTNNFKLKKYLLDNF